MGATVRTATVPIALAAALILSSCTQHLPVVDAAAQMRPAEPSAEDKNIIIAKVNGAVITNYACIDMMNRLSAIDLRGGVPESQESTRKRAVDILVLQELALQAAVHQGLRVDEMLVDRTVEQFIRKAGHEEGFTEYLARRHITPVEFRAQVERSLMIQRILTEEVLKKTLVTEDDIQKEYERTRTEQIAPENVSIEEVRSEIEGSLKTAASIKRRQEWERELQKDAKIEILAPFAQPGEKKPY